MTIDNMQSILLIPQFLRDDKSIMGLCAAVDYIFARLRDGVRRAAIRTNLDYLEEEDLDYVASAENIFWYKSDDSIDVKRDMLRSYRKIFRIMGTTFAVEEVLKNIFQSDYTVLESKQYAGEPFHFMINLNEFYGDVSDLKNSTERIRKAKNARSVLDGFQNCFGLSQDDVINIGIKIESEAEIGMEDVNEV